MVKLKFNPSMDGPLGMDELNLLHADAVKFGKAGDNVWFEAVDAKTLDNLITEMNEMNRWFAKIVKYWDEFTSGGDGKKVLEENGVGIQNRDISDAGPEEEAAEGDPPAGEDGGEPTDGEGEGEAKDGDVENENEPNEAVEEGNGEGEGDIPPAEEDEAKANGAPEEEGNAPEGEEGEGAPEGEEGEGALEGEEGEGANEEAEEGGPADDEAEAPKVGRGKFGGNFMKPMGRRTRPLYDYNYGGNGAGMRRMM